MLKCSKVLSCKLFRNTYAGFFFYEGYKLNHFHAFILSLPGSKYLFALVKQGLYGQETMS